MRHTAVNLRRALAVSALALMAMGATTTGAGAADSAACWPLAADTGNLTGAYQTLPGELVEVLMTPTDCGPDWPAAADVGALSPA